jgi:hypothetical protein
MSAGPRHSQAGGRRLASWRQDRSGGAHMYILPSEITTTGTTVNTDRKARNTDQIIVRLGTVLGESPSKKR